MAFSVVIRRAAIVLRWACSETCRPRHATLASYISSRSEILCPRFHQFAALLEEIPARVGGLGLVLDHVRKRRLHDRVRRVGPLGRIVAEARPRPAVSFQLADTKQIISFRPKPFPTDLPTWTDWRSVGESELARGRERRRAQGRGHQPDLGHPTCVGCENHAPKGVQIVLPDRSKRRAMNAVVQSGWG